MRKRSTTAEWLLSLVLSLVLLVQGTMPAGYMPASVDSGWLVTLCPDGLPAGFLIDSADSSSAAHHHHHHHSAANHLSAAGGGSDGGNHDHTSSAAATDYCPLGSALNAAELATGLALPLAEVRLPQHWQPVPDARLLRLRYAIPASRGPPVS